VKKSVKNAQKLTQNEQKVTGLGRKLTEMNGLARVGLNRFAVDLRLADLW
jgi:hypothetical protein